MVRTRQRHLIRLLNSFDFAALEPGDLVLVANPTDPWIVRAFVFWSHVAIYVGGPDDDRAFVDAVNLPVRRAGKRAERGLPWQRVRFTSRRMFRSYVDILVLRPDLPSEARTAAAAFAAAQVGAPFPERFLDALARPPGYRHDRRRDQRRDQRHDYRHGRPPDPKAFSCASLVWHAYYRQGLDLSSGPLGWLLLPWPSRLGHDRRLRRVGMGTRYRCLAPARGMLLPLLTRVWARWVLRSAIIWRGVTGTGEQKRDEKEVAGPAASIVRPPSPDASSRPAGRGGR